MCRNNKEYVSKRWFVILILSPASGREGIIVTDRVPRQANLVCKKLASRASDAGAPSRASPACQSSREGPCVPAQLRGAPWFLLRRAASRTANFIGLVLGCIKFWRSVKIRSRCLQVNTYSFCRLFKIVHQTFASLESLQAPKLFAKW